MGSVEVYRAPAVARGRDETAAGERLPRVIDQGAAELRVAELVAHGAARTEVFDAIADEVSALLGRSPVAVLLVDEVGAVVVATRHSAASVGHRVPSTAGSAMDRLLRSGRPAGSHPDGRRAPAGPTREDSGARTTVVPVAVGDRVRAALVASSSTGWPEAEVEACLDRFAELAAAAITRADEHARLTESRARILARADASRRRLQRDLHDGPQQRVAHALIALKVARATLEVGSPAAALVEEALTNVERAGRGLRDLVEGILPRSLTHGGLRTGLESLVAGLPVPVTLHVTGQRSPAAAEVTAYFLVAEAVVNAVRHSHAGAITVTVAVTADTMVVEIADDGVGGADPAHGGGLTSLQDRVDVAAGSLTITSPAGHGTVIRAELPLRPPGSGPDDGRRPGEL